MIPSLQFGVLQQKVQVLESHLGVHADAQVFRVFFVFRSTMIPHTLCNINIIIVNCYYNFMPMLQSRHLSNKSTVNHFLHTFWPDWQVKDPRCLLHSLFELERLHEKHFSSAIKIVKAMRISICNRGN